MRTQRRITDVPYVLRKNGYFYGHDSKGYVARFELAELYSKARAESEAQQVEGVTAHPITEFARDSDALDALIDRLEIMRDAAQLVEDDIVDHDVTLDDDASDPTQAEADLARHVAIWFANDENVGLSSSTIASYLGLGHLPRHKAHPHDPSDLNRCLLLLDEIPALRPLMPKMAGVSEQWSKLIGRWDEIEACFIDEVGRGWEKATSAPRTYNLMKQVLGNQW